MECYYCLSETVRGNTIENFNGHDVWRGWQKGFTQALYKNSINEFLCRTRNKKKIVIINVFLYNDNYMNKP